MSDTKMEQLWATCDALSARIRELERQQELVDVQKSAAVWHHECLQRDMKLESIRGYLGGLINKLSRLAEDAEDLVADRMSPAARHEAGIELREVLQGIQQALGVVQDEETS